MRRITHDNEEDIDWWFAVSVVHIRPTAKAARLRLLAISRWKIEISIHYDWFFTNVLPTSVDE